MINLIKIKNVNFINLAQIDFTKLLTNKKIVLKFNNFKTLKNPNHTYSYNKYIKVEF